MIFFAQLKQVRRLAVLVVTGAAVLPLSATAAPAPGPPPPNPTAAYSLQNAWSFVSAPTLHPPKLLADRPIRAKKVAPGYFMLSSFKNLTQTTTPMSGQGGPLLVDNRLQPVWFKPDCITGCDSQDIWTQDLEQQMFNGKPALSWWEGALSPVGVTQRGKIFVIDQHYRTVAVLGGSGGWIVDSHDLVISGHNAWVTVTKNVPVDLTAYGGSPNGTVVDTAVQEYDLRTGQLLYTWDPLVHIPLSDSYTKPSPMGTPWDAYHLNSLQLGHGTFLAGFRSAWAGYLINIRTQATQWILGGKRSSFSFGPGAAFSWQHNIQLYPQGIVSLFDNECCAITGVKNGAAQFAPANGPARGLVLRLDMSKHTATLVSQYTRGADFHVAFTGSLQLLPSGQVVIGWGSQPFFSEYTKAGQTALDAEWPGADLSYRADVTQSWVGTPFYPPSGAVRTKHGKTTVYASWNGSTEVQAWQVLAGSSAKHLKVVAGAPRAGFETVIHLKRGYRAYKVRALDGKGRVLRTSGRFPKSTATTSTPGH
jgi:hypothetical protein